MNKFIFFVISILAVGALLLFMGPIGIADPPVVTGQGGEDVGKVEGNLQTSPPSVLQHLTYSSGIAVGLSPEAIEAGSTFGRAVALDDGTAVIGAPGVENSKGAVFIFEQQGGKWVETAYLTASDGAPNDFFGQAVAIDEDTLIVGASGHDALGFETGAAYVFQRENGTWGQKEKLMPNSPLDVRFGWSVAIDGETIVVGAPYRNQGEIINLGSATIFTHKGGRWEMQTRLTSGRSGGAGNSDLFGWAVDVEASMIAVGAHLAEVVYLYKFSNGQWHEQTVLKDTTPSSQFGYSLSLAGNTLVVGAPAANSLGPRAGVAIRFVEQERGWVETGRFLPVGLSPGSRFGWAVATVVYVIVVGARELGGGMDVEEAGSVFAFQWVEGQPIFLGEYASPTPSRQAHFGHAVAVHSAIVLVGIPGQEQSSGAIYLISLK